MRIYVMEVAKDEHQHIDQIQNRGKHHAIWIVRHSASSQNKNTKISLMLVDSREWGTYFGSEMHILSTEVLTQTQNKMRFILSKEITFGKFN